MNSEVSIFNNGEVLILLPNEVSIEFKGDFLIRAKDVSDALGYSQTVDFLSLVKDKYIHKIQNRNVLDLENSQIRKLNNAGEKFITSFGLNQAIAKSHKEKAERFQDWLYEEVLPSVTNKGRFDAIENKIEGIEDEKEKQLKLKVHKINQVLEIDPDDRFMQIQLKDAEKELQMYKQQKEIFEVKNEVKILNETLTEVKKDNELIKQQQLFVCNRTNFDDRVKILANKYFGRKINIAYRELFKKMRLLGSFDVYSRRNNEWEKINADRAKENKKPLKESSLKKEYNFLDVIDDYNKWELASEAYKTIEIELAS